MGDGLQKFLLSDVYVAIYMMSFFEEWYLLELRDQPKCKRLFTKSLERDLYLERLKRFGIDQKTLNDLQQLKGEKSWSEVYYILEYFQRNKDWDYFIKDAYELDDMIALRICDYFYAPVPIPRADERWYAKMISEYQPKRICRYLIRNKRVTRYLLELCNFVIDGQWNED